MISPLSGLGRAIGIGVLALMPLTGAGQWIGDSSSEAAIQRGILYIYNLSLDSARTQFRTVTKSHPDHPAGYFFLSTVEWWGILIDFDNTSKDEKLLSLLDKTIEVCDKRLDLNENDTAALFFKGGALGFRGRLHGNRTDWLKAANAGREALPIVHKAYSLDPGNYDILLGIGIYDYYAAIIPEQFPLVKPLMLLFPSGDKQRGLRELRRAADSARYAGIEASYFLMQVLQNYEHRYDEAMNIASQLSLRFPMNAVFHKYVGRCAASLGRWEEMHLTWSEILRRVNEHKPGYTSNIEREAEYYLGQYEMESGSYDSALAHLYRCDELSRKLDTGEPSGFMIVANLRIGMLYDLQMKRELALKQYEKVLKLNDYMNSHKQAEEYRKVPYRKS